MAEPGSPRVSAPASRQLYIRTHGRRPRDEREIADVFQRYGEVRYVRLMPHRDTGFVSYWRTRDACEAREALHERSVHGMDFDVQFSRSTRLLHIDAVPPGMAYNSIVELIKSEFSRFGPIQLLEVTRDRRLVHILFQHEADAIQSVAALQGHTVGEWKWEIEFHKERGTTNPPSSLELPPSSVETVPASTPAAPAANHASRSIRILGDGEGLFSQSSNGSNSAPQRLSITRSELARRASQRTGLRTSGGEQAVSTPSSSYATSSPKRERSFEASTTDRAPEQSQVDKRPLSSSRQESESARPAAADRGRSRSRSPSRTPSRSRSRSPKAKYRRRSASPESASHASPSDSSRSPSPAERKRKKSGRSRSPAPVPSHTCDRCEDLIHHWRNSHTERDEEMCKKLVAAWFRGNFDVIVSDNDAPPGMVVVRRSTFLRKEINPFLRSLGFRAWSSTSSLYTEWFLRELNGLSTSQLRRDREFRFLRRTSRSGYRDMLQSLLAELDR